jgi:hypothetical protein
VAPWLLAALLACQGPRPTAAPAAPPTAPPGLVSPTAAPPATATPAVTAAATAPATLAGPTGLAGLVIAASDVAGQPDAPLPDQLVLAVAVTDADDVLGPGTSTLSDAELRNLRADLPAPHPALATTVSDAAGAYTLSLAPGDHLLCLANTDTLPPSFPARTRGCGRATVPPGAPARVDISSGFGEILLITP